MGTHPIFESDFDCLTEMRIVIRSEEKHITKSYYMNPTDRFESTFRSFCRDVGVPRDHYYFASMYMPLIDDRETPKSCDFLDGECIDAIQHYEGGQRRST